MYYHSWEVPDETTPRFYVSPYRPRWIAGRLRPSPAGRADHDSRPINHTGLIARVYYACPGGWRSTLVNIRCSQPHSDAQLERGARRNHGGAPGGGPTSWC